MKLMLKIIVALGVIFAVMVAIFLYLAPTASAPPPPAVAEIESNPLAATTATSTPEIDQSILSRLPEIREGSRQATLLAVGDIMLSRSVEELMKKRNDWTLPFKPLAAKLKAADITFGNLETPLIAGRPIAINEMIFRADPKAAAGLQLAGFDILSLANNHTANFGSAGLNATFETLNKAGIKYAGAGRNSAEASAPVIIEKNGIKFGFLAYTYPAEIKAGNFASEKKAGVNRLDREKMIRDVGALKKNADQVIVSMHNGKEYEAEPDKSQTDFARAAIEAGASLVIGHHPHVVQPLERYKNGYIIYSLGNFIFDQFWSEETQQGLAVEIYFGKAEVRSIKFLPLRINRDFQPVLALDREAGAIMDRLKFPAIAAPGLVWREEKYQELSEWAYLSKDDNFQSYQSADLDNDGQDEEAVVINRTGYLIRNNKAVWQTDKDWQVDNVLIGDYNNDKILEVGFSLWKQGSYGPSKPFWVKENDKEISNHLFLYQWQVGAIHESPIRMVWGSSALDFPIVRMKLADPENDQRNELLVLEKADEKNFRLGIWRFSNFNFFNEFKTGKGTDLVWD